MYSVIVPMYQVDVVARYLCILVRWIIYHIDTLLLFPTLVSIFHVRLISSLGFGVSCHLYLGVQLLFFVCLLIRCRLQSSLPGQVLFQWRFFRSTVTFRQSFAASTCFSGVLHDHLLFLSSETFPSLEASSVLHQYLSACFPSLLGVGFFPCGFFYLSSFQRFGCAWVPHQVLFSKTQFYFQQQFLGFQLLPKFILRGVVRVIRYFLIN